MDGPDITDLSQLSHITTIGGTLGIFGIDVTDLSGLEGITAVGSLSIQNSSLTSLNGLDNLVSISYDLHVEGSSLANIDALGNIGSVNSLEVLQTQLPNLDGLSGLASIGQSALISDNSLLTNVDELNNITSIPGSVTIRSNPQLTHVGLNGLVSAGDFEISSNNQVSDLDAMGNLTTVTGNFVIYDNASLTNLNGFTGLSGNVETLLVQLNSSLTSISGLSGITNTSVHLQIMDNEALMTLNGLQNITAVGAELMVTGNAALNNGCAIYYLLTTPGAIGGSATIYSNATGTNSQAEIIAYCTDNDGDTYTEIDGDCNDANAGVYPGASEICNSVDDNCDGIIDNGASGPYTGTVIFTSQAQLNAFPSCYTSITGNLEINGADITDLSPLSNITSVGGSLNVFNATITDLSGLGGITSVYELVVDNDLITSLNGLNSLTSITYKIFLECNSLVNIDALGNISSVRHVEIYQTDLTDLDGLSSLSSIEGSVIMMYNTVLTNIDALRNIPSIPNGLFLWSNPMLTSVGLNSLALVGNISIRSCNQLTDLDSLGNLTTLVGYMELMDNAALSNLNGLSGLSGNPNYIYLSNNASLASVSGLSGITSLSSDLIIFGSPPLTTLDGLQNITTVGGVLTITNNSSLSNGCAIYNLITIPYAVGSGISVGSNAPGANSEAEIITNCGDADDDGYSIADGDCDDNNEAINPGETETCNNIDDDCANGVDDGLTLYTYYADNDGDSYGNETGGTTSSCSETAPEGYAASNNDCNDNNENVNPGASEVCNSVDDDCANGTDDGLSFTTYYADNDDDGYGNALGGTTSTCNGVPADYSTTNDDCNDSNSNVNPGETETCNSVDDDCANGVDDGLTTYNYYADNDNDGYGNGAGGVYITCISETPAGFSTSDDDCNDTNENVNPGETEFCNGVDDNCANGVDDGLTTYTYYADNDDDGYGNGAGGTYVTCTSETPEGYSTTADDCNDEIEAINPGATETCNGVDDNCNNLTDEGLTTIYYYDKDGDGFGENLSQELCAPTGFYTATVGGDCNNDNETIYPGAPEQCNLTDDDCDGFADNGLDFITYYVDFDDDGYGSDLIPGVSLCLNPGDGFTTTNGDCNDFNDGINPTATEICNNVDDNCDGSVDENGVPAVITAAGSTTFCAEGSVVLSAGPTGPYYGYQWFDQNGPVNAATNSSYSATGTGTYYVEITSFNCLGTSNSIAVTENPLPVANVTPAGPFTLCEGIPIPLSATSGAGLTYKWYKANNEIAGETNDTYTVPANSAKSYKVVITNSFGCSTTSNVVSVARLATPNANVIIVNPSGNPDLCINGKVKLRGNGSSDVSLGYQWKFNGDDIPAATDRNYTALAEGAYRVVVTNLSTGCSRLSDAVAVINTCKESSAADPSGIEMSLYPNPTDGHFMLQMNFTEKRDGNAMVSVYNSLGQSVLQENVPVTDGLLSKEIQLRNSDAAGLYFVRVVYDGHLFNGQLVYQH
ncbi:MAG TPA: MopE-related protein [Chitinophagales bacterium]|nr:MopE-related protein [Chitinophagales bacterium]